ncbi:DUF1656 domain-containing protein [Alteromonas sp. 1_MG-2023]|uniref:DUF1656 domain-containing protein n=1 Tax=unclassified Alteromonas TaxID=2614992 RepID=UPI0026E3BD72|nr:DUF1656 domain-containing protein [Alteromonas sp. 1_MG-2023]MDO6475403.1 DUF1656 domain-containing protein [Alteromonas sp. 1_MG-2023]
MLSELSLGGMLFSPMVVMIPLAFLFSLLTRYGLYATGLYQKLWKPPWFEVALFICYLAATVKMLAG